MYRIEVQYLSDIFEYFSGNIVDGETQCTSTLYTIQMSKLAKILMQNNIYIVQCCKNYMFIKKLKLIRYFKYTNRF